MRATLLAGLTMAAIVAMTGCSTKVNYYAKGGSRADGTVDMAYDFRAFETPVVNDQQARSIAKSKCSVWGYSDAEAFGGKTQNCLRVDGWGNCVAGQVVVTYQCTTGSGGGAPDSSLSLSPAPAAPAKLSGEPSKAQWQQQQVQQLQQETGLSYEEYMRRYKAIMAE